MARADRRGARSGRKSRSKRARAKPAESAGATPEKDSRLEGFLSAARGHLDKGELEAAHQQYTKASGIAEGEPRVLETWQRASA